MSSPPTISITTGCGPDDPDVLVGSSSRVPCNYPEIDFVGYIDFRTFRFLVSSEQLPKDTVYSVWKTPQPHPPVLFHEFVEYFLVVWTSVRSGSLDMSGFDTIPLEDHQHVLKEQLRRLLVLHFWATWLLTILFSSRCLLSKRCTRPETFSNWLCLSRDQHWDAQVSGQHDSGRIRGWTWPDQQLPKIIRLLCHTLWICNNQPSQTHHDRDSLHPHTEKKDQSFWWNNVSHVSGSIESWSCSWWGHRHSSPLKCPDVQIPLSVIQVGDVIH